MSYRVEIRLKDGWVDVSLCNATLLVYETLENAQQAIDAMLENFRASSDLKPLLRIVRNETR